MICPSRIPLPAVEPLRSGKASQPGSVPSLRSPAGSYFFDDAIASLFRGDATRPGLDTSAIASALRMRGAEIYNALSRRERS
jgi:hypothetical protein